MDESIGRRRPLEPVGVAAGRSRWWSWQAEPVVGRGSRRLLEVEVVVAAGGRGSWWPMGPVVVVAAGGRWSRCWSLEPWESVAVGGLVCQCTLESMAAAVGRSRWWSWRPQVARRFQSVGTTELFVESE